MPEVLEIEEIEIEQKENQKLKIASWLVEIPPDVIEDLGLAKGQRIALTIKNGEVSGNVLSPMSPKLKVVARRILEKRRGLYEELKRFGD